MILTPERRFSKQKSSSSRRYVITALALHAASLTVAALILLADLPREGIGALVMLLVVLLLLTGVPIGIGMAGAAIIGMVRLMPADGVVSTLKEIVFGSTASWTLSVIPMFILMGIALWKSGLSAKAFDSATQWLGRVPGGLAVATTFTGAGMAAASGSSLGITYALGRTGIPAMLKAGYKPSLATASVAAAGTLGQLIPPSILLIVYAGVAQTSIGPQLIAAAVPGVLLALGFAMMIVVRVAISPQLAPAADLDGVTWRTRFASLPGGIGPVAIVVLVVIGGLAFGVFTPTEAGAFGALAAIVYGWLGAPENRTGAGFRRFIGSSLYTTVTSTASIFLLVIGVMMLTRVLALSRLTNFASQEILALGLSAAQVLLALMLLYLVLGMFLDPLAMILLTVPVLVAPLTALGVDMIWFGVFLVILCEIGQLSPPIGLLSFVVHRIAQDGAVNLGHRISLVEVFKGVMPFIGVALAMLLLMLAFPEIALWLPNVSAVQ